MKAHLIDTHLLVPRSRSCAKVKVKYQGHVTQKMGVLGTLVFDIHILFFSDPAHGILMRLHGNFLAFPFLKNSSKNLSPMKMLVAMAIKVKNI